jgi:hypothetical protein
MKKLFVSFLSVAALVASAATHRITLYQESIVNGTTLKPGEYKLRVEGDRAVISAGKTSVEVPVTVESGDAKYGATAVRYLNGDGKYRLNEIRIGGTSTKLVVGGGSAKAE